MQHVVDRSEFLEAVAKADLFLAYLSSPDCGVCSSIRPKVETLLERHRSVDSRYVDITVAQELAAQENIFTIPAIILYVRGKEAFRWARNFGIGEIEEKIERYEGILELA